MKFVLFLLFEYVIDPLVDRIKGRDWTIEDAQYRAAFLRQQEQHRATPTRRNEP